ncbi:MAG: GntR family transcriptional regulator [Magnetospirillum sp.]|nr:GntR family transcriptional regulator [Magnetospirillum sp.]
MRTDDVLEGSRTVDRVYTDIKKMVINYDILPGQQIHIEDVSNSLTVSVTPVREALNRLLNEGFIRRKAGRGFYNRNIDIIELADLFHLRGSLAISTLHFIFRTDLRKNIMNIIEGCAGPSAAANGLQMPLCANMIRATGNNEMVRIYNNIIERISFVWDIYSSSQKGKADIQNYRTNLKKHLLDGDLSSCIDVIDRNISIQISALDDVIREGFGKLFSKRPPMHRQGPAPLQIHPQIYSI